MPGKTPLSEWHRNFFSLFPFDLKLSGLYFGVKVISKIPLHCCGVPPKFFFRKLAESIGKVLSGYFPTLKGGTFRVPFSLKGTFLDFHSGTFRVALALKGYFPGLSDWLSESPKFKIFKDELVKCCLHLHFYAKELSNLSILRYYQPQIWFLCNKTRKSGTGGYGKSELFDKLYRLLNESNFWPVPPRYWTPLIDWYNNKTF